MKAFDNKTYLALQREAIMERINKFGDKLYLEFGGKLFDDYHASRVLPGFKPDAKLQMLLGLKDICEIVIAVNTDDIVNNRLRADLGITYQEEVERLIDAYRQSGLLINSVVFSFYKESQTVNLFIEKLNKNNINVYRHYEIAGYPFDIETVVSEEGFGKNEYVLTQRKLVIVTAPGPGSGKLATCLSQLYHDKMRGIASGYAKYETFPVAQLSLDHPVNIAYEAATLDLNDVNMIDPFHLAAYGIQTTNYNRDVEAFPLLKSMFEKIYGASPYASPTDMGVNKIAFGIKDEEKVIEASKQEIIRRYYKALKNHYLGIYNASCVTKAKSLMNHAGISIDDRPCVKACLDKHNQTNKETCAIEINKKKIITGKESDLLSSTSAVLLNALKYFGKIDDKILLLTKSVIEPIQTLRVDYLHYPNPKIGVSEILVSLSIQALTNPLAQVALEQLPKLKGLQLHSSKLMSEADFKAFRRLGVDVTEEATNNSNLLFINK